MLVKGATNDGNQISHYWFKLRAGACSALSHCLNQCRCTAICTMGNRFQWNMNEYTTIFIHASSWTYRLHNGGHFGFTWICEKTVQKSLLWWMCHGIAEVAVFVVQLGQRLAFETVSFQMDLRGDNLSMMTSSNGTIFRVTGPLCGEYTGPGQFPTLRPVTRSFDVFFDLRLNKRLSKQPWGWWFETLSWSLWRHYKVSDAMDQCT